MPASGEAVGNRVRSRLLGEENDYEQCDFRVIPPAAVRLLDIHQ